MPTIRQSYPVYIETNKSLITDTCIALAVITVTARLIREANYALRWLVSRHCACMHHTTLEPVASALHSVAWIYLTQQ